MKKVLLVVCFLCLVMMMLVYFPIYINNKIIESDYYNLAFVCRPKGCKKVACFSGLNKFNISQKYVNESINIILWYSIEDPRDLLSCYNIQYEIINNQNDIDVWLNESPKEIYEKFCNIPFKKGYYFITYSIRVLAPNYDIRTF